MNGKRIQETVRQEMGRKVPAMTLIEVLLVMVIIGVVVGVAYTRYGRTMELNAANQTMAELQELRAGVHNLYGGSSVYTGISNTILIDHGAAPATLVKGTSLINGWNAAVTVAVAATPDQFTITYVGVPREACAKMATFQRLDWSAVTVGGTAIPATDPTATALTACSADTNTIVWQSF
jgi:prepilin-type N-terminal cleavage/methylation domain-containing protein